jgi:hypothetical protein
VASAKADQIRHAMVPNIVSAATAEEFEAKWEEFVASIVNDADIAQYEKLMTELIQDRMELWK